METTPPKPVATTIRHEITRLPELTPGRKVFRRLFHSFVRLLVRLLVSLRVQGMENIVRQGPVLIVSNHLGDADWLVGLAIAPYEVESFVKSELYDFPVLGKVLEAYGVIWIHRGQPDRRAIRSALEGLQSGRILAIAPEGRESVTGALEEGTGGAAYLGIKSGAPIQPVTVTGTENSRIFSNLKRLRRSQVTITIGPAFSLERQGSLRLDIEAGTERIMHTLAGQLPIEYRGVYRELMPGE
jgi:1-acyl-sn-glycerol-3-phosphate acyltransferase